MRPGEALKCCWMGVAIQGEEEEEEEEGGRRRNSRGLNLLFCQWERDRENGPPSPSPSPVMGSSSSSSSSSSCRGVKFQTFTLSLSVWQDVLANLLVFCERERLCGDKPPHTFFSCGRKKKDIWEIAVRVYYVLLRARWNGLLGSLLPGWSKNRISMAHKKMTKPLFSLSLSPFPHPSLLPPFSYSFVSRFSSSLRGGEMARNTHLGLLTSSSFIVFPWRILSQAMGSLACHGIVVKRKGASVCYSSCIFSLHREEAASSLTKVCAESKVKSVFSILHFFFSLSLCRMHASMQISPCSRYALGGYALSSSSLSLPPSFSAFSAHHLTWGETTCEVPEREKGGKKLLSLPSSPLMLHDHDFAPFFSLSSLPHSWPCTIMMPRGQDFFSKDG